MARYLYSDKCYSVSNWPTVFFRIYHCSAEREPVVGAGDNSRSSKSRKLEHSPISSIGFLVSCNEAFGYSHQQTLGSSYVLMSAMLAEYSYIWRDRNRSYETEGDKEGEDFVWVELPDYDNPGSFKKYKKYKDVAGKISTSHITNL